MKNIEKYLDEVAMVSNFELWEQVLTGIDCETVTANTVNDIVAEANRRMLEDAFKAQKEICENHAEKYYFDKGQSFDKSSIKNAPTPTIDNQNKN